MLNSTRSGFTLAEVLLAIALIGLLASLSLINFTGIIRTLEDPGEETAVLLAVQDLRLEALRQRQMLFIRLVEGSADDSSPSSQSSPSLQLTAENPSGVVLSIPLPPTIIALEFLPDQTFADFSLPNQPAAHIGPTGRLGFAGLQLTFEDNETTTLPLAPLTGALRTQNTSPK